MILMDRCYSLKTPVPSPPPFSIDAFSWLSYQAILCGHFSDLLEVLFIKEISVKTFQL